MKKFLVGFTACILFCITAGFALANGAVSFSAGQTIYACVTGVNGNIVKVSNIEKQCPKNTYPISWNSAGQKGDQGPKGEPGNGLNQVAHLENAEEVSPGAVVTGSGASKVSSKSYWENSHAPAAQWTADAFVHVIKDGNVWAIDPRSGEYLATSLYEPQYVYFTGYSCQGSFFVHDESEIESRSNPKVFEHQAYLFFDYRKYWDTFTGWDWRENPEGISIVEFSRTHLEPDQIHSIMDQRGDTCFSRLNWNWNTIHNYSNLSLLGTFFEAKSLKEPQALGPLHWVG
ncbi:MAG: hypothetical protein EBZ61_08145 [Micrococcales bacterium]|nr:hypothetical protein [Micrococcales bacterium]